MPDASTPGLSSPTQRYDVAIVGAGLAGLYAIAPPAQAWA